MSDPNSQGMRHGFERGCTSPLQLVPTYRDYLWGGQRLRPGQLTAEAWVVYEGNVIASGPLTGQTLERIAAEDPVHLVGKEALTRTGARFPLLIKILDCAQWLSLQVHPDDAQALALEGPGHFGKTEAWYVLDAAPGAQIIAGLQPETTAGVLADAIRDGTILDWSVYRDVRAGDTVFMPAQTIHAVGPGLLMYEVQQSSDLTYRVFDWDRPPAPGRELHIDKAVAVAHPAASPWVRPAPALAQARPAILAACPYFTLELLAGQASPVPADTGGDTFHALTVIEGVARLVVRPGGNDDAPLVLRQFDSVVIPAACGPYEIEPLGSCRILRASTG